jgi:general secretion pathway protein I
LYHSTQPNGAICAGFSLIEVLVALAVVSFTLSSIGALIASTARGNRSIEAHFFTLETARAIMATIPDRGQLTVGDKSGEMADYGWRVEVSPFRVQKTDRRVATTWIPQSVVVSVQAPTGVLMQVSTVRLRHGSDK